MSFAAPDSALVRFIRTPYFIPMAALSVATIAIWAMGGLGTPPIEQPQPVGPYPVPPGESPFPTGQDGQRFPTPGDKPPLEAPRPTFH